MLSDELCWFVSIWNELAWRKNLKLLLVRNHFEEINNRENGDDEHPIESDVLR